MEPDEIFSVWHDKLKGLLKYKLTAINYFCNTPNKFSHFFVNMKGNFNPLNTY